MNDKYKLALELAKEFIKNSNVTPLYNPHYENTYNEVDKLVFLVDNQEFTFLNIVSYFLENVEMVERWKRSE